MRNFSREWPWVNAELGNILAKITPFFALAVRARNCRVDRNAAAD